MNKKNNFDYDLSENDQEINLVNIFKKLKRNIYLILSITSLSILSYYYAKNEISIYSGQFQILVRQDEKDNLASSLTAGILPKKFSAATSLKKLRN